jgi:dihydroorotase
MPYIDPHVHCRDGKLSYKATIKSVTDLARSQYVIAIFDMPNTDPPIISRHDVNERIKLAQSEGCLDGYYLYIGATNDKNQLEEAVEVAMNHPRVVGIKYSTAGKGKLAIKDEDEQKKVYETLAKCDYTGVLCVHSEKESYFKMDKWNPERPWTWNMARPSTAETGAVKDQIRFVKETGFKGTLYIPHVSVPTTVDTINEARNNISIVCGVTPHHLTISTSDMKDMEWKKGIMYKVNPPVRSLWSVFGLREHLKLKKINWIESDHAPHSFKDKTEKFMSGFPSLENYFDTLRKLRDWGLPKEEILDLTYTNIKRVFTKVRERL